MDRRNFLRAILGTAAATALPSEVWPFRKIFLPPAPTIVMAGQLEYLVQPIYDFYAIDFHTTKGSKLHLFPMPKQP